MPFNWNGFTRILHLILIVFLKGSNYTVPNKINSDLEC